jgi:tetratricopeptide (TPR) repeat protein
LLFVYAPLGILGFVVFVVYFYTLSKKPISKAISFFNKGKKTYIRGDYKNALENFLNVLELVPDANFLYKNIIQYINLLIKVGKYQKALEVVNLLPEEYKNSLSVINAMTACYIELNKPDMALVVLEKGHMRKRKTDTEEMRIYRYLLGTVYMKLGQKEKALKQFQKIYVEDSNFLDVAEILSEKQ